MDWISREFVGSGGNALVVWLVVFVKGISLCMRVRRPPPFPWVLSSLNVVYPGNLGV